MEVTLLKYTLLPDDARRLVQQFLRKPHPTALLMKALRFEQTECGLYLRVWGASLRILGGDWPPRLCRFSDSRKTDFPKFPNSLEFYFDGTTGEPPWGSLRFQ